MPREIGESQPWRLRNLNTLARLSYISDRFFFETNLGLYQTLELFDKKKEKKKKKVEILLYCRTLQLFVYNLEFVL
jgi:hypothetical protein